jgi:SAM-dependent methyltransferase
MARAGGEDGGGGGVAGTGASADVTCSYDAVPYSVGAFPQTRPDRLATAATLFGMRPAPPSRCRVLELGCASGGNLIPMALADPGSRFVGVDLSRRQVEDGRAVAGELGLTNIDLRAMSIADIGEGFGEFDYVLAHGVYSWVPPEVQGKILEVCSRNLAPGGVAYVSYNTYPGWHARGAIREMLGYHTARVKDPGDRVKAARGLLAFLAGSAPQADGGYGGMIRQELAVLAATPDTYLLHEHLEEYNEPLYFHEFARRCAGHGLQYLGEAQVSAMMPGRFGDEAERTLRRISPDLLHMEQYMDFLRNRMFRQTLVCHAGEPLDYALRPAAVRGLYVASPAKGVPAEGAGADGAGQYQGVGEATLTTRDPLMRAAMGVLGERWPASVGFEELLGAARARVGAGRAPDDEATAAGLATRVLNCYTMGVVELSVSGSGFTTAVGERPVASPYARLRAREGGKVVNMRLETVVLGEPSRVVIAHLDGRHDVAALEGVVREWMGRRTGGTGGDGNGGGLAGRARQYVAAVLPAFARNALLVG